VQSSTDPPKKLTLGERAVMADGNEYGIVLLKEAGQPVEPVYPIEGTPTISGPTGIFATAPHPNAASLFQAWLHTRETQQFFTDYTAQYSVHAQVQSKPGRRKISEIKLMKEDAAGVEAAAEQIKTRYARLFRGVSLQQSIHHRHSGASASFVVQLHIRESITTIVSMDSGPAPRGASRNDEERVIA